MAMAASSRGSVEGSRRGEGWFRKVSAVFSGGWTEGVVKCVMVKNYLGLPRSFLPLVPKLFAPGLFNDPDVGSIR